MDVLKGLGVAADVLRKADKIPEYQQILDAMEKLTAQQIQIATLASENRELKNKLKTREDLLFKNDAYWTSTGEGPFCLTCHGSKDLLIHMVSWGSGQHKCNNCNHIVDTDPAAVQEMIRRQEIENATHNHNWM
jgi:hypothetical protein